jgi:alpha-amylase
MTTKNNGMGSNRGIYDSEYDAFTNYMNILGDFLKRVKDMFSDNVENDELNSLYTQIANMDEELNVKENEISRLRARIKKLESLTEEKKEEEVQTQKKDSTERPEAKKRTCTKKTPAEKPSTSKTKSTAKG